MLPVILALGAAAGATVYLNGVTKSVQRWAFGQTMGEMMASGSTGQGGVFTTTSPSRTYITPGNPAPAWSSVAQLAVFLGFGVIALRVFEKVFPGRGG